jgi:hypothetical protein
MVTGSLVRWHERAFGRSAVRGRGVSFRFCTDPVSGLWSREQVGLALLHVGSCRDHALSSGFRSLHTSSKNALDMVSRRSIPRCRGGWVVPSLKCVGVRVSALFRPWIRFARSRPFRALLRAMRAPEFRVYTAFVPPPGTSSSSHGRHLAVGRAAPARARLHGCDPRSPARVPSHAPARRSRLPQSVRVHGRASRLLEGGGVAPPARGAVCGEVSRCLDVVARAAGESVRAREGCGGVGSVRERGCVVGVGRRAD